MDQFRALFGDSHIVMALAAMITRVKEAGRIDWTIPATWIVGMFFAMVVNLGVLIFGAATVLAHIDTLIDEQKKDAVAIARHTEEIAALKVQQSTLKAVQDQRDNEQLRLIQQLQVSGHKK